MMAIIGITLGSSLSKAHHNPFLNLLLSLSLTLIMITILTPSHWEFWSMSSLYLGQDLTSWALNLLSIWITIMMILASLNAQQTNICPSLLSRLFSFLLGFLLLSFSSTQTLPFYVFFEATLIPTMLIIMGWGYQPERLNASLYMLFYTLFASLPLLMTLLFLWVKTGVYTFNQPTNMLFPLANIALTLAFLVKLPVFMFHLWLPKAHVEAPAAGSMILAGVLLKLGGYGLIRVAPWSFSLPTLPNTLMALGLVGGTLTGFLCLIQIDMKSLVAYSSIGHMGIALAGILTLSNLGKSGALIMLIAHGLCSSGLFSMVSMFYEKSTSRTLFMNKGLLVTAPAITLWWFVMCVTNMACPPSINLASEIFLFVSILNYSYPTGMGLAILSFVGAAYSLYLFIFVAHGNKTTSSSATNFVERDFLLLIAHLAPLNLLTLKLGLFAFQPS